MSSTEKKEYVEKYFQGHLERSNQDMGDLRMILWQVRGILDEYGLWLTPDSRSGFMYAVTEIGETFDAYIRKTRPDDKRNQEGKPVDFLEELGDAWIMLVTAMGEDFRYISPAVPKMTDHLDALVEINYHLAIAFRRYHHFEKWQYNAEAAVKTIEQVSLVLSWQVRGKLHKIAHRELLKAYQVGRDLPYADIAVKLETILGDTEAAPSLIGAFTAA